ncbi:MAG: hypothetical protein K2M06_08625 [Muribaculaceae bacterium]|nr:hypothetical protein [Muribaculaceae bacterium]
MAVVLYATLWPDPEFADDLPLIPHLDKLIHAVMMGGLFGALVFDTRRLMLRRGNTGPIPVQTLLRFALGLALFCVADEILQKELTTTRSAEFLDILADWTGVAIAFFVAPPAVRCVLRQKD